MDFVPGPPRAKSSAAGLGQGLNAMTDPHSHGDRAGAQARFRLKRGAPKRHSPAAHFDRILNHGLRVIDLISAGDFIPWGNVEKS
jgi:hypothetical protein